MSNYDKSPNFDAKKFDEEDIFPPEVVSGKGPQNPLVKKLVSTSLGRWVLGGLAALGLAVGADLAANNTDLAPDATSPAPTSVIQPERAPEGSTLAAPTFGDANFRLELSDKQAPPSMKVTPDTTPESNN